eukprot:jgi/Galph1/490/GphlegSOOS_G5158.1
MAETGGVSKVESDSTSLGTRISLPIEKEGKQTGNMNFANDDIMSGTPSKSLTAPRHPPFFKEYSQNNFRRRPNVDLKVRVPSSNAESPSCSASLSEWKVNTGRINSAISPGEIDDMEKEKKSETRSEQYGSPSFSTLAENVGFGSTSALRSWSSDKVPERRTGYNKEYEHSSSMEEFKSQYASLPSRGSGARSPFRAGSSSETANLNIMSSRLGGSDWLEQKSPTDEDNQFVDRIISDESERNPKITSATMAKHRRQGSGTSVSSRKTLTEHSPVHAQSHSINDMETLFNVVHERKRQSAEIKSAFDELVRDLEYLRKAREEDDAYLGIIRDRLEIMDQSVNEKAVECDKLAEELANLDEEMAKLEESAKETSKLATGEDFQRLGAVKAMSLLENHLKALHMATEAQNALAEALERRLQVAKKGISLFSGPDAKNRYEAALKSIEEHSSRLQSARTRCTIAREELRKLREQRDLVVPVIERAEQIKKELQDTEVEADFLEQEVSKLRQELQQLDENFDSLDRLLEESQLQMTQGKSRIETASKLKEKLLSDCSTKMKLIEVLRDQCEEIKTQTASKETHGADLEHVNATMESALAQANEVMSLLSKAISSSKQSNGRTSKTDSITSSEQNVSHLAQSMNENADQTKAPRRRKQSPTKPPKPPKSLETPSLSTQESVLETDDHTILHHSMEVLSKPKQERMLPSSGIGNLVSCTVDYADSASTEQREESRETSSEARGSKKVEEGGDMLRSVGTTRSVNGVFDRLDPATSQHRSITSYRDQKSTSAASSLRGSCVNTVSTDWAYPLSSTTRNEDIRKESSVSSPFHTMNSRVNTKDDPKDTVTADATSHSGREISWSYIFIHGEMYNSRTLFVSPLEDTREAELYMDQKLSSNRIAVCWYRLPRGSNMIDRTALRTMGIQYVTTADDVGHRLVVEIEQNGTSNGNSDMEKPNAVTDIISTDPEMERKVSQWVSEGQKAFLVEDELTGERRGIFLSSSKIKVQKQTHRDQSSTNHMSDDVTGVWITEEKRSWASDPSIRLDDMDPLTFQLTLSHTFVFRTATCEQRDLIALSIRRFHSRFFALQRTRKIHCQFQ